MKTKKNISLLIICTFLVFGLVGCGDVEINPEISAYTGATQIIKGKLKAPSTAKFGSFSDSTVKKLPEDNLYLVSGFVDAENSFGAKIRSNYVVQIRLQDKNNFTYKIISFE